MRRRGLWLSSALVLASTLVACGRVQQDAPTPLHTGAAGDGGISASAGAAGGAQPDPAAQAGSDADAESTPGFAVTGTLIDSWRRPVSGCLVALGTATVLTGTQGEFRFEHVTPPYDIAFTVPGVPETLLGPQLWLYTGLTRADPTLQFGRVLVNRHTILYVEQTNLPVQAVDSAAKLGVGMSFAAPGVEFDASDLRQDDGYDSLAIGGQWSGGSSISGMMHSLAWLSPSGDPGGLDLKFLSYQEQPLTLVDSSSAPVTRVTFDFSPSTVPAETYPVTILGEPVTGTVLGSALAFDSNATIWLTTRQNPGALSNVPMPVLPGGHAVFSAWRSSPESGLGLVHRRADSSASVTELTIPMPQTLIAPDDEADGVTASTRFEWSAGANVSLLYIHCWQSGLDVMVVTAANSATWPVVPLPSSSFSNGNTCGWGVEVHGAFASIDDAAGPNGFLDACQYAGHCEGGRLLEDGTLTRSSWRTFTSAP